MATRTTAAQSVLQQLNAIERDGIITFGRGQTLDVTNLDKVFFPDDGYTKGDLMRYYASIAPLIVPTIADRPLILKRSPNGITGEFFFQQKAPADVPAGVRVETIAANGDRQRRVVGGDLLTLLYVIQLGCVSVDPWHSRVPSLDFADYTILDLDPGKDATFRDVVPVARWVKEVLDEYHLHAAVKTSGARGIHVYLPLPRQISNDRAKRLAQEVATEVVRRHPKETTITRSVSARKSTAVYVDYLQNDRGKSVAGPYCVRAKPGASVATPLAWEELTKALDPRRWTIETALTRFADVGDLWHEAMRRPNTVRAIRAFERAREA